MHSRFPTLRWSAGQQQFQLLVRHLLDRFFNNEMVSVDGDTLPLIMTMAWAIALPTLVATILMFPAYHGFPPKRLRPLFWTEVNNHYFYGMYAWVVMGTITVFEWDLLIPNVLDVFVLSVLPISNRRLLLARVAAVLIFLGLFLLGTGSLGIIFFPLATEPPNLLRAFAGHFCAVMVAGLGGAALMLALQGVVIGVLGARLFRILAGYLQSFIVMSLSIVLFSFPVLARSLAPLMQSGSTAVLWFPPFWFLGIYESIAGGAAGLPVFFRLAHIGYWATSLLVALAIVTYPAAYKRSTRQAVEGSIAPTARGPLVRPMNRALHGTLARTPSRRGVHHFISQTLFRSQRHCLYLAMYAGVGIALVAAWVAVFQVEGGHIMIGISTSGIRLAVPALAFWAVAGLSTALLSPAGPAGNWVFQLIHGKASLEHLRATRRWILLWALTVTLPAVAVLQLIGYPARRGLREECVQLLIAAGICLLLTDAFSLPMKTIPFTEARVPRNTDLAFTLLRYIVVLPALVVMTVQYEGWIAASANHLVAAALLIVATHLALRYLYGRVTAERVKRAALGEEGEISQVLGLGR